MLTHIELQRAVDLLLFYLEGHPAARALPSRHAGKSLQGELLEFRKSPSLDVKSIIPVLALVVGRAPDIEVWSEVFNLLSQQTSTDLASGQEPDLQVIGGLQSDWEDDYLGESHHVLERHLQAEEEKFDTNKRYAKVIPIIQSSGTGKSRLLSEMGKGYLMISFVLRNDLYSGYPFGDPEVTKFLLDGSSKEELHARCISLISFALRSCKMVL